MARNAVGGGKATAQKLTQLIAVQRISGEPLQYLDRRRLPIRPGKGLDLVFGEMRHGTADK